MISSISRRTQHERQVGQRLKLVVPDLAHQPLELRRCFFSAILPEAVWDLPPTLWHSLCEGCQLLVDIVRGGECVRGISLIASEDEAGNMREVSVVEIFGREPGSIVIEE